MTLKDLQIIQNDFRHLKESTIDYLEEIGYIKKGTFDGGNPVLNEGKREIVLTIKTFRELTLEELKTHFITEEEL